MDRLQHAACRSTLASATVRVSGHQFTSSQPPASRLIPQFAFERPSTNLPDKADMRAYYVLLAGAAASSEALSPMVELDKAEIVAEGVRSTTGGRRFLRVNRTVYDEEADGADNGEERKIDWAHIGGLGRTEVEAMEWLRSWLSEGISPTQVAKTLGVHNLPQDGAHQLECSRQVPTNALPEEYGPQPPLRRLDCCWYRPQCAKWQPLGLRRVPLSNQSVKLMELQTTSCRTVRAPFQIPGTP